jgi:hypothetical protein
MTRISALTMSTIRNDLEVVPLSDKEWRVSDARYAGNDGRSVLGFIGESRGQYEVVEFADPVRFTFFPTADAALKHLARTASRRIGPVSAA